MFKFKIFYLNNDLIFYHVCKEKSAAPIQSSIWKNAQRIRCDWWRLAIWFGLAIPHIVAKTTSSNALDLRIPGILESVVVGEAGFFQWLFF